mgnify:CR=1 FL=1
MNINTVNIRVIRELVIEDMTSRLFKRAVVGPVKMIGARMLEHSVNRKY